MSEKKAPTIRQVGPFQVLVNEDRLAGQLRSYEQTARHPLAFPDPGQDFAVPILMVMITAFVMTSFALKG